MSIVHTILKHIGGVEQYGIFSLCLFSSIFAGVLIYTLFQKRQHLDYMSRVALETADAEPSAPNACCETKASTQTSTITIQKESRE